MVAEKLGVTLTGPRGEAETSREAVVKLHRRSPRRGAKLGRPPRSIEISFKVSGDLSGNQRDCRTYEVHRSPWVAVLAPLICLRMGGES